MKVAADADRLRREGADVVDFGAGEPDFPTPDNIKRAGKAAIDANFTKYTAAGGTVDLKQALCERHATDYGTSYTPAECIVTVGGKHAIFNLLRCQQLPAIYPANRPLHGSDLYEAPPVLQDLQPIPIFHSSDSCRF